MSRTFISKEDLIIEGVAGEYSTFTVEFRTTNNYRKENFETEGLTDTILVYFYSNDYSVDLSSEFTYTVTQTDKSGKYKVNVNCTKTYENVKIIVAAKTDPSSSLRFNSTL